MLNNYDYTLDAFLADSHDIHDALIAEIKLKGKKVVLSGSGSVWCIGSGSHLFTGLESEAYKYRNHLVVTSFYTYNKNNSQVTDVDSQHLFFIHKDIAISAIAVVPRYVASLSGLVTHVYHNLFKHGLHPIVLFLFQKPENIVKKVATLKGRLAFIKLNKVLEGLTSRRAVLEPSYGLPVVRDPEPSPKCKVFEMLSAILKGCEQVTVETLAIKPPRDLVFRGDYSEMNIDLFVRRYTEQAGQQVIKGSTKLYYTPTTERQYNALCLMQAFTPHFRSCQYLPLQSFTVEDVEAFLNGDDSGISDFFSMFDYLPLQHLDFEDKSTLRYFTLDSEGYVKSRFHLFYDVSLLHYVANNYYNMEIQCFRIADVIYMPGNVRQYRGESYTNIIPCPPTVDNLEKKRDREDHDDLFYRREVILGVMNGDDGDEPF